MDRLRRSAMRATAAISGVGHRRSKAGTAPVPRRRAIPAGLWRSPASSKGCFGVVFQASLVRECGCLYELAVCVLTKERFSGHHALLRDGVHSPPKCEGRAAGADCSGTEGRVQSRRSLSFRRGTGVPRAGGTKRGRGGSKSWHSARPHDLRQDATGKPFTGHTDQDHHSGMTVFGEFEPDGIPGLCPRSARCEPFSRGCREARWDAVVPPRVHQQTALRPTGRRGDRRPRPCRRRPVPLPGLGNTKFAEIRPPRRAAVICDHEPLGTKQKRVGNGQCGGF